MKLESIASTLLEVKEDNFIGTSPTFKKLEQEVYSTQIGWCNACKLQMDCKIFMALSDLDLNDFTSDIIKYAKQTKESIFLPSIELGITVKKCSGFKKLN